MPRSFGEHYNNFSSIRNDRESLEMIQLFAEGWKESRTEKDVNDLGGNLRRI
jgi:hypothetical protein